MPIDLLLEDETAGEPAGGFGPADRDYVNALARGLEVIKVFTRHSPKMTLSEIASETGMTRATVRRFLLTLAHEGYVEVSGKHFSLRPKILELGFSALSSMDLWDVMQPVLNDLSEQLNESCFAAVLDGDSVIYVARATSNRRVNVGISIGSKVPAHCVSTGRVLLASLSEPDLHRYLDAMTLTRFTANTITSKVQLRSVLEEVRIQGWSIVDQELEIGLRSLSVPVKDGNGQIVAALNVCCPSNRITPDDMRTRVLALTLEAARNITQALQF
ncbi:IclR family transcriptional regulator C-terminal domain-containing protein [Rhizobium sp. RU36D]|uniref:IclR family transcriptional regulator domain-containing protein n=1 Tax=Rhizobium sp. RU36D TaxID=1907415 RepID=UPI0009D82939|nr:IclR family transcriptional regulator C-terminal domain-containing protein [Rhizobium sp. RU36D]SMD11864.1 transcriptional regulator, IclR family [Rhizobium sp. RU36D]